MITYAIVVQFKAYLNCTKIMPLWPVLVVLSRATSITHIEDNDPGSGFRIGRVPEQ